MTSPTWHRDPTGRPEHRYWDGEQWTAWLADQGATRFDADAVPDLPPPALLPPPPPPSPFAPPPPPPPPPPPTRPGGSERWSPFRSLRGLSVALFWLLGLMVTMVVGFAVAVVIAWHRLDQFEANPTRRTAQAYVDADDALDGLAGWLWIVGIAAFIVFVIFLLRAFRNTDLWEPEPSRWRSGWAIGAWFIPVANLILPLIVISEVWHRTPVIEPDGRRRAWYAPVVICWLTLLLGMASFAGIDNAGTTDSQRNDYVVALGAVVLLLVSLGFQLWIVKRLADRQAALASEVVPFG